MVLELTIAEVPEGRHVPESPSIGHGSEFGLESEDQADEAHCRPHHHKRAHHHHRSRPLPSPAPTLATLEDHDLFKETEEEEAARAEADEQRMIASSGWMHLYPAINGSSLFMQRMMQSSGSSSSANQNKHRIKLSSHMT